MNTSHRTWDVIVVGGGIIGLASAWRLAQKRLKVLLLERNTPGKEASWASAGMLAPYTEAEEDTPLLRMAIASREMYPDFLKNLEEETGLHVPYRDAGALFLALDEHEVQLLRSRFTWQKQMGFAVSSLEGAEIRKAEPALSDEVRLALFYPGDHQLDNRALVSTLLEAARRRGAEIRTGTTVLRLLREGNSIVGVEAANEKFVGKTVVMASGAWSSQIELNTGEKLPVYPTRGQIVAIRSAAAVLKHTLRYEGGYVAVFPENRLLLGGTMEDVGYSKANTVAAMTRIFERASAYCPPIASCEFTEAWAGLRPNTGDHFPILGRSTLDGLVYACGHFRNGILLTPITAQIVTDLITEGKTPVGLGPFHARRFSEAK